METALDRYRNRIQEQEDVEEWCCSQFGCLEGNLALDNPLRVTSIQEWPSVLVLTLKRWRWRGAVVMLDHEVACNRTLDLDGVTYKLVSVATHIGASPTEGHYVAYRNMNGNFVRLDDQVVTAAYTAPERAFAMTPKEKAYMLVYIRDDRRELPPNKFRRLTANRTMVLDISEASDDSASDVIVEEDKDRGLRMNSSEHVVIQHEDRDEDTEMKTFEATSEMAAPARDAYVGFTPEEEAAIEAAFAEIPSPDALVEPEPAKNPGRRPLSKFTPVERAAIESAIKEAGNVKQAVAALAATVPRLSVQDRNAPAYLSPSTVRNWVQNHTKLDRALALANTTRTRAAVETSANPGSDAPQQPPEAAAATRRAQATVKRRVHPVGSTKHKLPEAAAAVVHEALKRTNSVAALTSILEETLPGFSTSNADAPVYVARSTLRNWLARGTPTTSFGSVRDVSWQQEGMQTFAVGREQPRPWHPETEPSTVEDEWLLRGSWTFCSLCGRRRPRSNVENLSCLIPAVNCKHGCDPDAEDLCRPRGALTPQKEEKSAYKLEAYVTPVARYWEALVLQAGLTGLPLSSALSKKDLYALAPLEIKVDYETRRGGQATVTSKQKKTVVRGKWNAVSIQASKLTEAAARVFEWLMSNNKTYVRWVEHHRNLVAENRDSTVPWRDVPTAELLLRCPGIEVAARPWLYPLDSFADTDLATRLCKLNWLTVKSKASLRTSFLRKLTSRCLDYSQDFPLQCLVYDTAMARTITSIIAVANQRHIAPEHAAVHQDMFEGYWMLQIRKLEDVCRMELEKRGSLMGALPNVFFTVAPAEWRYVLPESLTVTDALSQQQSLITMHLYHTIQTLLEVHLLKNAESLKKVGLERILHWSRGIPADR